MISFFLVVGMWKSFRLLGESKSVSLKGKLPLFNIAAYTDRLGLLKFEFLDSFELKFRKDLLWTS